MRQPIVTTGIMFWGCVALTACANPGPPPGAPQRLAPPQVIEISPDTNATNVRIREVMIGFDAVISERPAETNATELSDLIIVSPRHGDVNVNWRRDNITIRPKQGWKPNTTYTVTVLPGIADLQGNIRKEPLEVVFSTGDSIASSMIRGTVFDWLQGKPAAGAVVEAVPRPDSSLVYTTRTDSFGNFQFRAPRAGTYTIRSSINTSKNRVFDDRMAYDSTQITLQDSTRLELLAFTHDTVGPQIGVVRMDDSVTVRATFSLAVDPVQPLDLSQFSLIGKDSTPVTIVSVTPVTLLKKQDDSLTRDTSNRDPIGRDTTAKTSSSDKKPSKPLLFRDVVIVVSAPLRPKTEYILRARNIRSPNGLTVANSEKSFTTPALLASPKASTAPATPGAQRSK